ncbi:stage III sporulation protein AB [Clostridium sp.]|uniref:stage III sporulation protein AB n=1 Tax=Clostridium sp. TaxID=1506 RepID=UPI002FC9635B
MFKFIILLMIFLCFCYIGYSYGDKFGKRHKRLKDILKSIILLQNEVIYNLAPLPEALFSIGAKSKMPLSKLFVNVADILLKGDGENVYEAFKAEYIKEKELYYLLEEDERVLGDFLRSLGELGVYGQDKMFDLVFANLNINIKEAEIISKKNTKLYRYLGVCIGAMIVIFLL